MSKPTDDRDRTIQVIEALSKIMSASGLSPSGFDKQAVYAWFVARYNPKPGGFTEIKHKSMFDGDKN